MGEVGDCPVICQRLPNNITGTKEFLVAAPSPHRKARSKSLHADVRVILHRTGS